MFNRVITKTWNDLEIVIGLNKIYSSFLMNATSHSSTVPEQTLDCISRLISHEFDQKSWNKAQEFDLYIASKQNRSNRMKDSSGKHCCTQYLYLIWKTFNPLRDNVTHMLHDC